MKKSIIWFLTIIMALTFCGLLYVQIMYMRNMVKMRDDQFSEGVKRSLYATTGKLEQDETKHFLERDLEKIETRYRPISQQMGVLSSTVTTTEGLTIKNDLTTTMSSNASAKNYNDNREMLRGLYLYQQGVLNDVVLNIINQSSNRPITQRADSATVAEYLRNELVNNGMDIPFEFAVVNRLGAIVYKSKGYDTAEQGTENVFVQALFPNDPKNRMNYVKVYFPTKEDYIFSSVKFMIPSFLFTLILMVVFIYTIVVAFRQKRLTEMKNDFINNMTHEFKTPISTISLGAQMLNDPAVLKSEKMLRHTASVINDETKRLRFQVEKVLQMSMFDRQKSTLRITEVSINPLIDNIARTFKLKVEKYGGSITTELRAEDDIAPVDEMHFTNVIFNLLDNAVKYRREDVPSRLVITTSNPDDDHMLITISDNGIGIRSEDIKRIFEKFYRVPTGNRHDVKGFGLGLAYVKKMVTEMGGSITVESELNHGTKFNIILPLTKNS